MNQNQPNQQPQRLENPSFSIRQSMTRYGIDYMTPYEEQTTIEIFANNIFSKLFDLYMAKTIEEAKSDLTLYSSLDPNGGQIRTTPWRNQKIQAFIR